MFFDVPCVFVKFHSKVMVILDVCDKKHNNKTEHVHCCVKRVAQNVSWCLMCLSDGPVPRRAVEHTELRCVVPTPSTKARAGVSALSQPCPSA